MAHLAGGEAGHNTVLKSERGIDVVNGPLGAAASGGSKAHHRSLGQLQNKVNVVDHQIQHHRDIISAIRVGAVAAAFQHHHLFIGHHLGELPECGIETLDMPDLKQTTGAMGGLDQRCGFILACGDRLFDQHMGTSFETGQPHRMVQKCGDCDADRLDLRNHVAIVGEPSTAELLGRQPTPFLIRIGDTDEVGVTQQAEHPGVVPSHVADADDPHLDRMHGGGSHRLTGGCWGRLSVFNRDSAQNPAGSRAPAQSAGQPWP